MMENNLAFVLRRGLLFNKSNLWFLPGEKKVRVTDKYQENGKMWMLIKYIEISQAYETGQIWTAGQTDAK